MSTAPSEEFLLEALDLIGNTTVLGVSYGIAFTLYFLCAQSLYPQLHKPDRRRQTQFTLGYISLLMFCATGVLALNARIIQLAYINHTDFPGGPLEYEGNYYTSSGSLSLACNTLDFTIEVLTMAVQVRHWSQFNQQY